MLTLRSEPIWLSADQIVEINRIIVGDSGEPHLLLSAPLLESACNKAVNHWHYNNEDDVVVLIVQFLLGIAQNHCFEQGNKRPAFTAAVIFLELSGYELTIQDTEELGKLVVRVITRELEEKEFTNMLSTFVNPL